MTAHEALTQQLSEPLSLEAAMALRAAAAERLTLARSAALRAETDYERASYQVFLAGNRLSEALRKQMTSQ